MCRDPQIQMTYPDQKSEERRRLDSLLATFGITPDHIDDGGGKPDIIFIYSSNTIGVEMTTSRPKKSTRISRRQIEAEWEGFQQRSREFQAAHPDIHNINVRLIFNNVVPKERQSFFEEIPVFIRSRINEIGPKTRRFPVSQFTSPLMKKYLRVLYLRTSEFAEWDSNITVGWVTRPNTTLSEIVAYKAERAKHYRPTTQLWLLVHCSHRISETLLVDGVDDLNALDDLTNELRNGHFRMRTSLPTTVSLSGSGP